MAVELPTTGPTRKDGPWNCESAPSITLTRWHYACPKCGNPVPFRDLVIIKETHLSENEVVRHLGHRCPSCGYSWQPTTQ